MKTINVDMYQTLAVAVGVLYLGGFLKKKSDFLKPSVFPLLSSAELFSLSYHVFFTSQE